MSGAIGATGARTRGRGPGPQAAGPGRDTKEQLAVYFGDMNIVCGRDYQITVRDE